MNFILSKNLLWNSDISSSNQPKVLSFSNEDGDNRNSSKGIDLHVINDIKFFEDAVEEIEKIKVAVDEKTQDSKISTDHKSKHVRSENTINKFHLLETLQISPKKEKRMHKCENKTDTISELLDSSSKSNISSTCLPAVPVKLKESSEVPEPPPSKIILMAEPDIIEFRNCEANKTYKKIIILHNISTWELARYQIEKLTNDSAFDVFEEPRNHTTIAPGISIRLIVEYRCDPLDEPEELLVVSVVNGMPVNVKLRATRDIPIIIAKNPSCPGLSANSSTEESSESTNVDTIDDSDSSNASYFSSSRTSTNTSHDTDSLMLIHASKEASLDCKTCFLGERTTIRNVLHSTGGKARFFIMSEMDWCSMSIKDVSVKNILIVPPFAVQPAYFILEPDQQLHLDTFFYPRHSGLQVEKLIIVTDNCSVKTIEVIGNGLIFEARLLLFDRNVQYQWIQTRENTLCTISYLDLGSCYRHEKPKISFVLTSKCQVDLYYRWEIDNTLTCPKERANLLERKDFCPCNLRIQPSQGLIRIHKPVTFTLEADLSNSVPGRYRSNLRLIIEDVPVAALPAQHNFSLRESQTKRRSCQKSVDIDFKNIDIRFECKALQTIQLAQDFSQYYNTTSNSAAEDDSGGFFFIMSSNLLDFVSNNEVKTKTFNDYLNSESSGEDEEDEVCGFLKGLGTCDCQPIEIIATAILRPPKPLYVAVEETFSVVLYNNSLKSVRYWWSPPVGLDHSRVRVKVSPKVDHMEPESSKIIKIKCLPMKTGKISSLFVTCNFNEKQRVTLAIECQVRAVSLCIYFPSISTTIHWDAHDYVTKFDKRGGKLILLKQRLKEEVEIKSIISKSGDKKRSNRSSPVIDSSRSESRETAEEDASSSATSTKVTSDNSSDTTTIDQQSRSLNSWYSTDEEEESFCSSQCYDTSLLTYVDVRARVMEEYYLNNGVIIDFNVTSEKSQRKQIFLINQSPLPSSFFVSTKNKWVENEAGNFLGDELRISMSGVKIEIDPKNSQIKPNDTIAIDIIVSSHTWGVYVDQVTLYINLLPPFIFWIRITNDELPLCYPISSENSSPLAGDPLVRFKVFNPGSAVPNQKVLIENKSNIPLYVNWHCFALNAGPADEEKPFNLVLDMFSPFMDFDEHMETDAQFYDSVKQFFAHALNADAVGSAPIELSDMMYQLFPRAKKIHDTRDDSTSTLPVPARRPNISQGTEFRLSLTPYFGEPTPLFSIVPRELFLPPRGKRSIEIVVNAVKIPYVFLNKLLCARACGFIRVATNFKYKDNVFYRKDGFYMPPTQVLLECQVRRPRFFIQSEKKCLSFDFHTKDFLQRNKTKLKSTNVISFINSENESLRISFNVCKPLCIKKISTKQKLFKSKRVIIHSSEIVQLEVKCQIDESWIEKMSKTFKKCTGLCKIITKTLSVTFKEGFTQLVELPIKIYFPTIKVSSTCIDFGQVPMGSNKFLTFDVENISELRQTVDLKTTDLRNVFSYYPKQISLASFSCADKKFTQIEVTFHPKEIKNYESVIEVYSKFDGLVGKCILKGSASTHC